MIRGRLKAALDALFAQGVEEGLWSSAAAGRYAVELPKHEGMGDFATNFALVVAGADKKKPRDIATLVVERLRGQTELIARCEIAG